MEAPLRKCKGCKTMIPVDGPKKCEPCLAKLREKAKNRRIGWVADGRCMTCGDALDVEGKTCRGCRSVTNGNRKKPRKGDPPTEKKCSRCHEILPIEAFGLFNDDQYQTYCKPCSKDRDQDLGVYRREVKAKSGGCVDCGEANPDLLSGNGREFSHARSKKAIDRAALAVTWRCVCCQRIHRAKSEPPTEYNRSWFTAGSLEEINNVIFKKKWIVWQAKVAVGGCVACPRRVDPTDYAASKAWDWDHVSPTTKDFDLARAKDAEITEEMVTAEIAKCQLMCANCHHLRTVVQAKAKAATAAGTAPVDPDARPPAEPMDDAK